MIELEPVRRKIGMLCQDGALFDSMNVYANVAFPLRERGKRDEKVINRMLQDALGMVNMNGHDNKMPVNLRGGMRNHVIETEIGQRAVLRLLRGGKEMETPVTIAAEPGA